MLQSFASGDPSSTSRWLSTLYQTVQRGFIEAECEGMRNTGRVATSHKREKDHCDTKIGSLNG